MRGVPPAAYHQRVGVGVNVGAREGLTAADRARVTVGGLTAAGLATGAAAA
jgi:hypothetical protein